MPLPAKPHIIDEQREFQLFVFCLDTHLFLFVLKLDENCVLSEEEIAPEENENVDQLKIIAAAVFFAEAVIGTVLPMVLGTNYSIWMTILNCFSGGVFLTAGMTLGVSLILIIVCEDLLPNLFPMEIQVSST